MGWHKRRLAIETINAITRGGPEPEIVLPDGEPLPTDCAPESLQRLGLQIITGGAS